MVWLSKCWQRIEMLLVFLFNGYKNTEASVYFIKNLFVGNNISGLSTGKE